MNKAQLKMVSDLYHKRAAEQGLTMFNDVPEGAKVQRWNVRDDCPEKDFKGVIEMTIIRKDQAQARGYFIVDYERDGQLHKRVSGITGETYYKIV